MGPKRTAKGKAPAGKIAPQTKTVATTGSMMPGMPKGKMPPGNANIPAGAKASLPKGKKK